MAPNEKRAKLESEFHVHMVMLSLENGNITPFEIWKIHCTEFPKLRHAASHILTVLPGSANVERIFL